MGLLLAREGKLDWGCTKRGRNTPVRLSSFSPALVAVFVSVMCVQNGNGADRCCVFFGFRNLAFRTAGGMDEFLLLVS